MPRKDERYRNEQAELLRKVLIVQLGLAGVQQQRIREIVGCDMNLVNSIVKYLQPKVGRQRQEGSREVLSIGV